MVNGPRRDDELKIGDVERLTGVSRSSIQYYVRLGLLPAPRKLGPKLFLFGAAHLDALQRVRAMREHEQLSLAEIRARIQEAAARGGKAPRHRGRGRVPQAPAAEDPRRAAILDAATRLFARDGYEGVRLVDVAREVGLSKTALYLSFTSKEALFVECIERIRFLVVPKDARDASKRDPDLGRRGVGRIRVVLARFEQYRMLTQLLVTVANGNDRPIAARARAAFHRMVTDVVPELRQAVRAGLYRDGDLELDAYLIWGALMGAGDFMTFRGAPRDVVARELLDLLAFGRQRGGRGERGARARRG